MAEIRSAVPLLIAFVDLTRFGAQSQRTDDLELAETIDAYYEHVGNVAAMLDATGVTLSVEAFRKLGPDVRARFKKHTPPITYIRLQDPRRSRSATHA